MSQSNYINTFTLVDTVCTKINTCAFLWGGWIPDVYSGYILRQHDDAEFLVVNLYKYRSKLQKIFDELSWDTKIVENGDLVIKKDNLKIHLGHIEIVGSNVFWFHNGKKGQIVFPKNWLNKQIVHFEGETFHAVTPEFQYVLKLHPEFMNPKWEHREKDRVDIKVLTKLLTQKAVNLKLIEEKMQETLLY